jgi:hypothetical protein
MAPSPEDDAANGVFGDCAVVSAVVGDHVTVWVDNVGVVVVVGGTVVVVVVVVELVVVVGGTVVVVVVVVVELVVVVGGTVVVVELVVVVGGTVVVVVVVGGIVVVVVVGGIVVVVVVATNSTGNAATDWASTVGSSDSVERRSTVPSASVCTVNAASPDEAFPLVTTRIWRFSSLTVRLISAPLFDSAYKSNSLPETVISEFSPVT